MTELGQALFGNKWEKHEAPGFISRDLYALSEMLGRRNPDAQAHGALGGEWGYGQNFDCETFSMFPYWWGDCECGYEQAEWEWDAANEHEPHCYQVAYEKIEGRHKWPEDANAKAQVRALCKERGFDPEHGSAIHCDCAYNANWKKFLAENDHADDCPIVRPNFLHKPSGLAVHWYKWIGRSTTVSRAISHGEWERIYDECRAVIRGGGG